MVGIIALKTDIDNPIRITIWENYNPEDTIQKSIRPVCIDPSVDSANVFKGRGFIVEDLIGIINPMMPRKRLREIKKINPNFKSYFLKFNENTIAPFNIIDIIAKFNRILYLFELINNISRLIGIIRNKGRIINLSTLRNIDNYTKKSQIPKYIYNNSVFLLNRFLEIYEDLLKKYFSYKEISNNVAIKYTDINEPLKISEYISISEDNPITQSVRQVCIDSSIDPQNFLKGFGFVLEDFLNCFGSGPPLNLHEIPYIKYKNLTVIPRNYIGLIMTSIKPTRNIEFYNNTVIGIYKSTLEHLSNNLKKSIEQEMDVNKLYS